MQTKIKTQSILVAYLTSGYFTLADNIWGKTSRCLSQHLPRYLLTTVFQLIDFLSLQALSKMCDYKFSKDPNWWDQSYQSLWGVIASAPSWNNSRPLSDSGRAVLPTSLTQGHGVMLKNSAATWHFY